MTPFYAHPDGQRCLVRFFVSDLDAPAGRMRVFDRAQRQLGTAGVLPLGDGRLYGELWLPLGALARFRTELEAPGLRRPIATWHTLTPEARWTLYWITLLDPEALQQYLASLDPITRAVAIAVLQGAGAMVNLVPAVLPTAIGDIPFLRLAEFGARVADRVGLARAPATAVTSAHLRMSSLPVVFGASGITTAVLTDAPAPALHWLGSGEGSRLLVVAVPTDAAPEPLGFLEGGDWMMRSLAQFLNATGSQGAAGETLAGGPGSATERVALVVGTEPRDVARAASSVREWNARFAYPRIILGDTPAFLRAASRGDVSPRVPPPAAAVPVPSRAEADGLAQARLAESRRRSEAMIACLATLVPGSGAGLERIANQLAMPAAGTLVFNPTSYARTELVRMADGSDRVATDIPPLGYAYFPSGTGDGGAWRPIHEDGPPLTIGTRQFQLALDPGTGAIRSLTPVADRTDWARADVGLNAVPGARLEATTREALPGVAARIVARRRALWGGEIHSTITLYERLPWIDIVNDADASSAGAVAYQFGFAPPVAEVEWEIPAGAGRATPPCEYTHLRWLRVMGEGGSALLAAREPAWGSADRDGTLTSYGPSGRSSFRMAVIPAGRFVFPEDPWRFGWGIEPAVTAPLRGRGRSVLPSFGSLLVLEQRGIAVVGMQRASDGDGVIVYLQELSGRSRVATLGTGLIGFEDARQVDLIERDLGPPIMVMRNGVGVSLPAHGVAAVRLLGVTLAGA